MGHFENLKNDFPDKIKEVRGKGLLTAFEMHDDKMLDGHHVTTELLTQPLVVEGGNTLTVLSSNTDSFDVAVSYLNIKKEITT